MRYFTTLAAAALSLLSLMPASVRAQEDAQGTTYVEPRGGVYGSTNKRVTVMGTYGGAAGYYGADGVALEAEGTGMAVQQQKRRATPLGPASHQETANAASVAGMARWNFVRTKQGTLFVGVGGGGVFADRDLPSNGSRQSGSSQADLGGSLAISKDVSLKVAGRYQQIGDFSDRGAGMVGGNLGLKISF